MCQASAVVNNNNDYMATKQRPKCQSVNLNMAAEAKARFIYKKDLFNYGAAGLGKRPWVDCSF